MGRLRWALLIVLLVFCARGDNARFELRGRLVPATRASISLHGATSPFEVSTLAEDDGAFRFRDLLPGTYTLGVFVPARGEVRRTIEIGPSQADSRNRVELKVEIHDADFESRDSLRRSVTVSAKELSIPDRARREFDEAGKSLARRDVEGAVSHLQRAVEMAPQFSDAWNHLGTIAYQSRDYARAEDCFRKALDAAPDSFQPLVNLGGVSLNLNQLDQALQYNLYAALTRPGDALANSQLGMTYFYMGKLDLAQKYLAEAIRIDPAHFSHPQLILAEIYLRKNDRAAAGQQFEAFLQYHPDSPDAGRIKEKLVQLRAPSDAGRSFAATSMARSFAESPDLEPFDGVPYSVVRKDGQAYLQNFDSSGHVRQTRVDAAIGSGRHARMLLTKTAAGFKELPLAWSTAAGGKYITAPAFGFSSDCLTCHARQSGDRLAGLGCPSCHAETGSGTPSQAACTRCHLDARGPRSAHGKAAVADENFELNSSGYRLLESHCYQNSAGKLTCTTCHPAHTFSKTMAEYRMVCRGCHPTMHNGAPLECPRCHMPKRPAQDALQMSVTDHRIQRPL